MKVKELINQLTSLNPEAIIVISMDNGYREVEYSDTTISGKVTLDDCKTEVWINGEI